MFKVNKQLALICSDSVFQELNLWGRPLSERSFSSYVDFIKNWLSDVADRLPKKRFKKHICQPLKP